MPGSVLQLPGSFCWRGIKTLAMAAESEIILSWGRPWEVISQLPALKPAWLTPTSLCSSPNLPAYKTSQLSLTRGKWFSGTVVCHFPWLLASRIKKMAFLITISCLSNFWVSCNKRLNPSSVKNPCSLSPRSCLKFLLPMSSISLCRKPFFLTFQVASYSLNLYQCLMKHPCKCLYVAILLLFLNYNLAPGVWGPSLFGPWLFSQAPAEIVLTKDYSQLPGMTHKRRDLH